MTRFPDLPPLPDITTPIKKVAEGLKSAAEGLKEADQAGREIGEALSDGRKTLGEMLRRKRPL